MGTSGYLLQETLAMDSVVSEAITDDEVIDYLAQVWRRTLAEDADGHLWLYSYYQGIVAQRRWRYVPDIGIKIMTYSPEEWAALCVKARVVIGLQRL